MWQSLILNYVTDLVAKVVAQGSTALVGAGLATGNQSQAIQAGIVAAIAVAVTAYQKYATKAVAAPAPSK